MQEGFTFCDVFCFIDYNQGHSFARCNSDVVLVFLERFSSAECSDLVMFVCIGLLVKVLRICHSSSEVFLDGMFSGVTADLGLSVVKTSLQVLVASWRG